MKRINVVGTSASGKSTLSKRIADKIGAPYVELDRLFWKPNWGETPDALLFESLEKELAGETWVLDGNYTRTIPVKWKKVDLVVWLDLPFYETLTQSIKRAFLRSMNQKELWPETGNKESFFKSFFTTDSVVWWMIKTHKKNRRHYESLMQEPQYSHIKFIRLTSHKQADDFVTSLNK